MSEYKINGVDFPVDPINKSWQKPTRGRNARGGNVNSDKRQVSLRFGTMDGMDAYWFLNLYMMQTSVSTLRLPSHDDPDGFTEYEGIIENASIRYQNFDTGIDGEDKEKWVDLDLTVTVYL